MDGKQRVNVAQFTDAYRSFGVNTYVGQADQTAINYRVDGVLTMAVGGRYVFTGDHKRILATISELTSSRLNTTGNVRGTNTGFIFDINSLRSSVTSNWKLRRSSTVAVSGGRRR